MPPRPCSRGRSRSTPATRGCRAVEHDAARIGSEQVPVTGSSGNGEVARMMDSASTIGALLESGADDAPALSAPDGIPLSYRALRALVADTARTLGARGIGPGDRVAIVLPNGPEMAAAFLGIGAAAAAAPLNPGYRAEEFSFYLTDLKARLLVTGSDTDTPAVAVANQLEIPVARLAARPERGAGSFDLELPDHAPGPIAVSSRAATADDTALVLHTSGTTSRPKIVPLAPADLCPSAAPAPGPRPGPRSCRWRTRTSAPRPPTSAAHSRSRRPIWGWSSCRSFTSTDWWPPCWRRCRRGARSAAHPDSTRSSSSPGSPRCAPPGTPASRRCTRRSCSGPRKTPAPWTVIGCASSARRLPPCRPR